MTPHRQPALRGDTPPPRRRVAGLRGRRRAGAGRRPHSLVPLMLGIGLLAVAALVGTTIVGNGSGKDREGITYAALPADNPTQGMVYDGLVPAAVGTLCAGSYDLGDETCTHGPAAAPAGLSVQRDVAPVAPKSPDPVAPTPESSSVPSDAVVVRDEGGSALTPGAPALIPDVVPGDADFVMGSNGVACDGDGSSGNRVQVLYLSEFGTPSRYTDFLGSMRAWTTGMDQIFDASAAETGGSRHIDFVTTPECRVDIDEVQVPEGALATFPGSIDALKTLGYNRTDRKYLIFADTNVYCGIGTYVADQRHDPGNRNNGGPSYARVDAGCWSSAVAARELTETLGAVLQGSPNATSTGGCTDEYDLICGPDRSGQPMRVVCPKKHEIRLDCDHDDYFSTAPKAGSYLARNWNIGDSSFLLRGDGGNDIPDSGSAVTTPVPATTAPAKKSKVEAPAAPVQAVLEVRDPTSTAVRLDWTPAAETATYQILVDGDPIAKTTATRAQLIGLKPDTSYQISVRDAAHHYNAKGSARSAPAARPAQNSWFVLTNSLTGGAADLYGARTANGTPITLSGNDGDAQQQWMLVPAATGTYTLKSMATGKCVLPLDGSAVAGTPLVQGDCTGDESVRWSLQASDHGFTLRSALGDLVVGVGNQRFGAHRVLTLQNGNGARHQSWTAVPG